MRQVIREIADRIACIHPAKLATLGYLLYVFLGWLALCLPLSQNITTSAMDNLFTATSAVSTTGLVTVSTSDNYSVFGEIVVLLLIQMGGLGYMTFSSFVILSRHDTLTTKRAGIARTVFSLPSSFRIDKFIRSVVAFSLVLELLGTAALYPTLAAAGVPYPLWSAIFHSVSSFCTAGFSLYNSSLEAFGGNFWINATIAVLSIFGAIGFIVCVDVWRVFRGKVKHITLTSRIILWVSAILILTGSLLMYLSEPSIQRLSPDRRILAAFFQAMSAATTVGFNTVPVGALSKATILVIITLMVFGASPSGTGGGLKSTTISVLFGVMRSALRGDHEVRFWGRPVPLARVWTAVASLGFYLTLLLIGTYSLELSEANSFSANLFEAASALGTVGLSMGITSALSAFGKLTVVLLMISGRLGPLTFAMALFTRPPVEIDENDRDVAV